MNIMQSSAHQQQQEASQMHNQKGTGSVCELFFSDLCITCDLCHKRFNKRSHLNRHQREKHSLGEVQFFQCTFQGCNKSFKRGSHLKRHMISHTHEKNFKCLLCIMSFGYKHHLDRHIKLIHNKELFKCGQCDSEFPKKKGLNKHVKICNRIEGEEKEEGNGNGKGKGKNKQQNKVLKKKKIAKNRVRKIMMKKDDNNRVNEIKLENQDHDNGVFKCLRLEENEIFFSEAEDDVGKTGKDEVMYKCNEDECFSAFKNSSSLRKHFKSVHHHEEQKPESKM